MRRFTDEEKLRAVDLYFEKNITTKEVVDCLGYPTRQNLERWLSKDPRYGGNFRHGFYSIDTKIKAVELYKGGAFTATQIAEKLNIGSMAVVLNWVQRVEQTGYAGLIPRKRGAAMPKPKLPEIPDDKDELKRRCEQLEMDNAILKETIEILKKDPRVDPRDLNNKEKTQLIDALKNTFPAKILMNRLGIARSSYYFHQQSLRRSDPYEKIRLQIVEIFESSRQTYGYRRIWMTFHNEKVKISEKVVRRLMAEAKLSVNYKKRRGYSSYQGEITPAPANELNQNFRADRPNEKWLTDITEMAAADGKVYLSPIIDCFDGLVVAWNMSRNPNAKLTDGMLKEAIEKLPAQSKPIIHTDRGVHYRWPSWIQIMEQAGLTRSMSRKACTPDNAACEGFFGRLKNEMYFDRGWEKRTVPQLMDALDDYINWYNYRRIKISLGGKSPIQYRQGLGLTSA